MSIYYVAILGFAEEGIELNKIYAQQCVQFLSEKGFGVATENISSTFNYAIESANKYGSNTLTIV